MQNDEIYVKSSRFLMDPTSPNLDLKFEVMYVCSMRVTEDFDCIYLYWTARVTVMKD